MTDRSIFTERLVLRPYRPQDVDTVVTILNDLTVSQWLARVPYPFTRAACRVVDEDGRDTWPRHMAITRGGEIVGAVGTIPHLGYYLAPGAWGHGIATEAARAALGHIFRVQDRAEITSGYFEGNVGSAKVLGKLGFKETGVGRRHCAALGRERPHVDMMLTRAAWEAGL